MRIEQWLYWLLAGGLVGLGIIGILTIGLPLLLLGAVLLVIGILRLRRDGLWVALLGVGLLPTLVLSRAIITAPPACPAGPMRHAAGTVGLACGGVPESYYILAVVFGALAIEGVVGVLARRFSR